ncbi:response regulator [Fibrisoma montanum]|uniref:Response regulator n=1 Tax=Fibrisoma montanum TaxID=2305895 RepID=A0A418MAB8_9BACT|nr:response regulator [Fibrisoma montanum]RIV23315.1 response regulator [Fibrisoma montanum]
MEGAPRTKSQVILIAEDEALVLKMLSYRLQKEGYTILTASDGKQALECLRANTPDLVITDLMMPYHSGLEILEYVKKTINARIPVIMLSATGQEQTVLKAFSLGADDYALKPFSPNEIVSRVRKHLASK